MILRTDQTLLHYRLVEEIGKGGMGVVWRAVDTALDRPVALKILPEAFSSDSDRLARFEREARLLATLNHSNIASIYGLHQADEVHFLAMELVSGEDLADRLARGAVRLEDALAIGLQIAQALEAAHEAGVIHRDLKPANVKLAEDGAVKVLDFGLAKALKDGETSAATSPSLSPTMTSTGTVAGMLMGTSAYMSPEQAKGKPVDRSADLWAFGVLLFEVLSGQQPFARETVSETLASVLMTEADLANLPVDTPPVVRSLIARCLIRDPGLRLRDIREARIALQRPDDDSLLSGSPAPTAIGETPRPSRVPWVVAAIATVAAGLAVWAPWRDEVPPPPLRHLRIELSRDISLFSSEYGATAVLSPDGTRVAYAVNEAGDDGIATRLVVRDLNELNARPSSSFVEGYHPFFSPDGRSLGSATRNRLRTMSVFGGAPQDIADVSLSRGATWGADGTIIYAATPNSGLSRIPATGGDPEQLTELAADEYTHRWPTFLPDGGAVLFVSNAGPTGFDDGTIELLDLRSRQRKVLHRGGSYPRYVANGHVVFVRAATLYGLPFDVRRRVVTGSPFPLLQNVTSGVHTGGAQFSVSSDGLLLYREGSPFELRQLVRVDRNGNETPLVPDPATYSDPALSPDGRHLAVSIGDSGASIWILDLERGVRSRFTFSESDDWGPVWSPDGQTIAFSSTRDGIGDVFVKPLDGTADPVRLTESKLQLQAAAWFPDGKHLLLERRSPDTGLDIVMLNVETRDIRPLIATPAQDLYPTLSPDGRWVAYASDVSGRREVYVQRFPGPGARTQVSTAGGDEPFWSSDGSTIYFQGSASEVYEVKMRASGERLFPERAQLRFRLAVVPRSLRIAPEGSHFIAAKIVDDDAAGKHVNLITEWFRHPAWSQASR